MATLFTKIINRDIPGYIVAENADFIAFLDVFPLVMGHTLVVPKKETDYIFDMDDAGLAELMIFSKKVAKALRSVVPCERIGVSVIGLEVPHTHIHLVPIHTVQDINFSKPKLSPEKAEMIELTGKIKAAFEAL
ncbi:MAG: HIT family protein [Bacteroidia bacterium]|nr:HIT family protein [Bacteroidia bacterium]